MFEYKEENLKYFITGDKIKGDFGPFDGIYCKNKYIGNIKAEDVDEKKYPGYKYSIGVYKNKFFIISKEGIEKITSPNISL